MQKIAEILLAKNNAFAVTDNIWKIPGIATYVFFFKITFIDKQSFWMAFSFDIEQISYPRSPHITFYDSHHLQVVKGPFESFWSYEDFSFIFFSCFILFLKCAKW